MREVAIIGAGMTPFGRVPDADLRALGSAAILSALADADISASEVGLVVHGSAIAGLTTGQEMVRGQVVVSDTALAGVPLLNVENACATSSSAVHVALMAIRSGQCDTAVVCGTEVMTPPGTRAALDALATAGPVDRLATMAEEITGRAGPAESFFMEVYAQMTREYMARSGATAEDFAAVAAKNTRHGAQNPDAQYRTARRPEEILASRVVADPVRMLMCSPVSDGAAALVLRAVDASVPAGSVRVRASALSSGVPGGTGTETVEQRAIALAYEQAGVGPADLDVVEVHDAASPNELMMCEQLGLGSGPELLASGATEIGGRVPVNTSGGLVNRGHPVGATGCAQLVELVAQLRGRAGARQVSGARIGLAENAGGYVHPEAAACVVTILEAA